MTQVDGTITETTTLGDLVTAHPALARELERHGLDYCCGGQQSLGVASRALGLDPAAVVEELVRAGVGDGAAPWAGMSVVELVDHVEGTHHRFLWDELPRLSALGDKVVSVHGSRHPELVEVATVLAELRADLEPHLTKEERVLFPAIRALATAPSPPTFPFGPVTNPISVMLREHDRAGEILAELRAATDAYRVPDDGCASYRAWYDGLAAVEADTHLHVPKENNLLFPAVVTLEARRRSA
jgi:regulator of cell morphogenesis and NO signaling